MAVGEFALIDRYFRRASAAQSVELGIGDDCALLRMPADKLLAVSLDTLVADVHFPADAAPQDIAQRALRVNLSDLAAVGAQPLWFTLGLTLPRMDHPWLADFSRGLFEAADEFGVHLVGGDTTRGPLSISIQVHGAVAPGKALTRSGAKVGDLVYVSGSLGDGAAGLAVLQGRLSAEAAQQEYLLGRYHRPRPHLKEGALLLGIASSALDVSDGLLADLGHICKASNVGARINLEKLPFSDALQQRLSAQAITQEQLTLWGLSGGDDYRLCFTVSPEKTAQLQALQHEYKIEAWPVGVITAGSEVECFLNGKQRQIDNTGYNHFDDDKT